MSIQKTAMTGWSRSMLRLRRRRCRRRSIKDIQRGSGGRRRGSGWSCRSGWCWGSDKVVVVIVVEIIFYTDSRNLGDNTRFPSRHGLSIIHAIHPHCQGSFITISTWDQRSFESKMIPTRQRKGLFDFSQSRRIARLFWFGR